MSIKNISIIAVRVSDSGLVMLGVIPTSASKEEVVNKIATLCVGEVGYEYKKEGQYIPEKDIIIALVERAIKEGVEFWEIGAEGSERMCVTEDTPRHYLEEHIEVVVSEQGWQKVS